VGEYTIQFEGDHLEVHSDGDKDMDFAYSIWAAIIEACKKHDCYHVLGIANTTKPLTPVDGFEHAEMLRELEYPSRFRVAWVELVPEFREVAKFVETVLFNRGIGEIKMFEDVEAARAWLFSKEGV
jgi:hypothetical protein